MYAEKHHADPFLKHFNLHMYFSFSITPGAKWFCMAQCEKSYNLRNVTWLGLTILCHRYIEKEMMGSFCWPFGRWWRLALPTITIIITSWRNSSGLLIDIIKSLFVKTKTKTYLCWQFCVFWSTHFIRMIKYHHSNEVCWPEHTKLSTQVSFGFGFDKWTLN